MRLGLLFGSAVLIVAFQNCGSRGFEAPLDVLAAKGNGEGYDGKVLREFAHRSASNPCPDRSQARSELQQREDGFYVTAENCEAVSPRPLDAEAVDYLPHNQNYALYDGRVYKDTAATSPGQGDGNAAGILTWLCRGSTNEAAGRTAVHDTQVALTQTGAIVGVRRALYESDGSWFESVFRSINAGSAKQDTSATFTGILTSPDFLELEIAAGGSAEMAYSLEFESVGRRSAGVAQTCYRF